MLGNACRNGDATTRKSQDDARTDLTEAFGDQVAEQVACVIPVPEPFHEEPVPLSRGTAEEPCDDAGGSAKPEAIP